MGKLGPDEPGDRMKNGYKFRWVAISYLLALLAACVAFSLLPGHSLLFRLFIADVLATVVIFTFSFLFRNSSFYDPYWSLAPIALAFTFLFHDEGAQPLRQTVVLILTIVWGVRLTGNWAYGWRGLAHEDWRYLELKAATGRFWWPVSFLGIHLFPTLIVFLGCLSMYPAVSAGGQPLNLIDALALLVTAAAVWLETRSDIELHRFRRLRKSEGEFLATGVWAWCRHPNYLGEIGFWTGLFLFGYAARGNTDDYISAGPLAMILLFLFVSIPMIDRKLVRDKPGYEDYRKTAFALLPFPVPGRRPTGRDR